MQKILTICLFWIIAAPLAADEYKQDILSHLAERLPQHLRVVESDLRYRDFPGNGSGRLSVAGQLMLTQDLYEVRTDQNQRPILPALQSRITSKGYSLTELRDALQRLRYIRIGILSLREVDVVTPIGSKTEFSAELYYMETVSGIRVSRSEVEFPDNLGLVAGAIPSQYYIVDHPSEDVVVQEVAGVIDALRAELAAEAERARQQAVAREQARLAALQPRVADCTWPEFESFDICFRVTLVRGGEPFTIAKSQNSNCIGRDDRRGTRLERSGDGTFIYLHDGSNQNVTFHIFEMEVGQRYRTANIDFTCGG